MQRPVLTLAVVSTRHPWPLSTRSAPPIYLGTATHPGQQPVHPWTAHPRRYYAQEGGFLHAVPRCLGMCTSHLSASEASSLAASQKIAALQSAAAPTTCICLTMWVCKCKQTRCTNCLDIGDVHSPNNMIAIPTAQPTSATTGVQEFVYRGSQAGEASRSLGISQGVYSS